MNTLLPRVSITVARLRAASSHPNASDGNDPSLLSPPAAFVFTFSARRRRQHYLFASPSWSFSHCSLLSLHVLTSLFQMGVFNVARLHLGYNAHRRGELRANFDHLGFPKGTFPLDSTRHEMPRSDEPALAFFRFATVEPITLRLYFLIVQWHRKTG